MEFYKEESLQAKGDKGQVERLCLPGRTEPETSLFPGADIPRGVLRWGVDLREETGLRLENSGCGSQAPRSAYLL